MNFKKDLSKLAYIASDGKGQLVTISYTDREVDREQQFFISGVVAFTTDIFETDLVKGFLSDISSKWKTEKIESGKVEQETLGDSYYTELLKNALVEGKRYLYEDFDRYHNDNICPSEELMGMNLGFIGKVSKLFEEQIQYVFHDKYIIGVNAYTNIPLFIVGGISMPKQQSLLESND